MQRKLVHHHNHIGHEINISLEEYPKSDREIYCRKLHKITVPLEKHCKDCPAFAGWMQGHGHECVWEDVSTDMHMDIPFKNKFDELERVTKLIEDGTLDRKIYDSNKWIYKRSDDNKSRFALGTKGDKTLICFGVNPSVAAPEATDPTIKNVTAFATKNGYDSYIMLNLYPQRATDPKNMDKERNDEYHSQNLKAIKEIFKVLQDEQEDINILASWGNLIDENDYLKSCFTAIVELSKDYKCNWICLGKTKYHHPKHPSRLSHETKLIPFDIDSYNHLIIGSEHTNKIYLGEFTVEDKKRFLAEINRPKNRIVPQGEEVVFLDDADEDELKEYFAINPMTGEKLYKKNTIISYGYSDTENKALQDKLPRNCELFVTDCFTDVLAVPSVYQFVNPLALSKEEMEQLATYWVDISTVY